MTGLAAATATAASAGAGYQARVFTRADELVANLPALRRTEALVDFYATWPWFETLSRTGLDATWPRRWIWVREQATGREFCLPMVLKPRSAATVVGGATCSLSNYYSSLFAPIGDPYAATVDGLRAALRALAAHDGWPAVLDLQPLDAEGLFIERMTQAMQAEGYAVDRYRCFGNWHLPVLGRSFAAYEPKLPSRIRNTIQRGRKKLDGAGRWSLQVHTTPGPALDQGIADFNAIYAQSWKVPEPFPDFVPALCRMAAAEGWLRLGVIRFEDTPIASQLWIVKHGRALIYKLAYDEAYKRFSAGSVLSAELMRRALDEDRVDEVDYLTGDDAYKQDWMSHRRERVGLAGFRRTSLGGLLGWARHRAGALRNGVDR